MLISPAARLCFPPCCVESNKSNKLILSPHFELHFSCYFQTASFKPLIILSVSAIINRAQNEVASFRYVAVLVVIVLTCTLQCWHQHSINTEGGHESSPLFTNCFKADGWGNKQACSFSQPPGHKQGRDVQTQPCECSTTLSIASYLSPLTLGGIGSGVASGQMFLLLTYIYVTWAYTFRPTIPMLQWCIIYRSSCHILYHVHGGVLLYKMAPICQSSRIICESL